MMPRLEDLAESLPAIAESIDKGSYIIGIDPGASGGVAFYGGGIITVHKMPGTERDILDLLRGECLDHAFCYIEWIHPAIQNIGKSPMSKLYGNYMGLRMALLACEIPFETVQAHKWQQSLGISKRGKTETQTKWKNRLKAKAQELFPEKKTGIKITLAKCDAMLIAEYGRRQRAGE